MVTVELHETLPTSVLLQFMIPLLVVIGWTVWSETSWKNPTVPVMNCGLKSAFLLAFTVISHCTTAKSRAVYSSAPLACERSRQTPNPHFFSLVPSFLYSKTNGKGPYRGGGFGCTQRPIVYGYCCGRVFNLGMGKEGSSVLTPL